MTLDLLNGNATVHDRARAVVTEDRKMFSASNTAEVRRAREFLRTRIAQGARGMFSEVGTLTPALAEIILAEHNGGNRPLRATAAEKWANEIREGRWKLTAQGISFSPEGTLNNGQHRCVGVVSAGRPVPMNFTFGEPRDAFLVHDTGSLRSASDVLSVKGEAQTSALAGAVRTFYIVQRGGRGNYGITNEVVASIVDANPGLRHAASVGHTIAGRLKTSPSGIAVAYFLINRDSERKNRTEAFFDALRTGADLAGERNPILVLRNSLLSRQVRAPSGQNGGAWVAASTIIAWNAWVRGKKTISVKWPDGVEFPAVN